LDRPERDALLKEVARVLVEEGGQATMARLYFRLHGRLNLSFYQFAEEVRRSGMFTITRPAGWENDLVSLSGLDVGPEGAARERVELARAPDGSRRRCGCRE